MVSRHPSTITRAKPSASSARSRASSGCSSAPADPARRAAAAAWLVLPRRIRARERALLLAVLGAVVIARLAGRPVEVDRGRAVGDPIPVLVGLRRAVDLPDAEHDRAVEHGAHAALVGGAIERAEMHRQ